MNANMNIYRIVSCVITDDEFVVAPGPKVAIDTYVKRFETQHVTERDITLVERVSEKCLISE